MASVNRKTHLHIFPVKFLFATQIGSGYQDGQYFGFHTGLMISRPTQIKIKFDSLYDHI